MALVCRPSIGQPPGVGQVAAVGRDAAPSRQRGAAPWSLRFGPADDEFLILASDGLLEKMSPERICSVASAAAAGDEAAHQAAQQPLTIALGPAGGGADPPHPVIVMPCPAPLPGCVDCCRQSLPGESAHLRCVLPSSAQDRAAAATLTPSRIAASCSSKCLYEEAWIRTSEG